MKWIFGILAGLFLAVRGFLQGMKEERLTAERDAALADAKTQSIKAEAKAHESEMLNQQRKNEDAIHAADSSDIASQLDAMHKR